MKLKEAQKRWDDALQIKATLLRKMKKDQVENMIHFANPDAKIIYMNIGSKSFTCISSVKAQIEENRQKSMIPGTKVRMTGAEAELEHLKDESPPKSHFFQNSFELVQRPLVGTAG